LFFAGKKLLKSWVVANRHAGSKGILSATGWQMMKDGIEGRS